MKSPEISNLYYCLIFGAIRRLARLRGGGYASYPAVIFRLNFISFVPYYHSYCHNLGYNLE